MWEKIEENVLSDAKESHVCKENDGWFSCLCLTNADVILRTFTYEAIPSKMGGLGTLVWFEIIPMVRQIPKELPWLRLGWISWWEAEKIAHVWGAWKHPGSTRREGRGKQKPTNEKSQIRVEKQQLHSYNVKGSEGLEDIKNFTKQTLNQ